MTELTREDRRFLENEGDPSEGLNGTGKRNAKHRREILEEIERTNETVKAYLERHLKLADPQHWVEQFVDPALADRLLEDAGFIAPMHRALKDFDFRSTLTVLQYNLKQGTLVFERGQVTPHMVNAVRRIRNDYEHYNTSLNTREYREDINTIRVFRSRFQSDADIAEEEYEATDLEGMSASADEYDRRLSLLQQRLDDYALQLMRLDEQASDRARTDERQDRELQKQAEADERQDSELDERARIDALHDERDAAHDRRFDAIEQEVSSLAAAVDGVNGRVEVLGGRAVALLGIAAVTGALTLFAAFVRRR